MLSKNVKLTCAVYDEAEVFTVEIDRTAWVDHLRRMIHLQRYKYQFDFFEVDLKFRLARKNGEWLQQDEKLFELLRGPIDSEYEEMRTIWSLEGYLGSDFQPGVHEIHVLVEIPSERLPPLLKPIEVHVMKTSMETFLNAVAYKLSTLYDFKCEDKDAPTIREALCRLRTATGTIKWRMVQ